MTDQTATQARQATSDEIDEHISIDNLRAALTEMIELIARDRTISTKEKVDALGTINYTFALITGQVR